MTGSFRTVGGVVTAVDPATGEIKINELEKKTPLTIVIKQDAVLRKISAARTNGMMGGMRGGEGGGPGGPPAQGGQAGARPQGGPPAGGPGGGPGGPGGVAASISTKCSKDCQLFRLLMLRLATPSSFPVRREWIPLV